MREGQWSGCPSRQRGRESDTEKKRVREMDVKGGWVINRQGVGRGRHAETETYIKTCIFKAIICICIFT